VLIQTNVNEFYKKGCQEKSSPSTGGREDFVSRSSPLGQFPRIDPITLAAIPQQGVSSRIADYKMADVRLQQVM
jgi:hypothetical protein